MSSSLWISFPLSLCLCATLLVVYREQVVTVVPRLAPFSAASHEASKAKVVAASLIPVHGISQAFTLGRLFERKSLGKCDDNCEAQFRTLVGPDYRPSMQLTDLEMYDASQTLVQRAAGFVSLTNVLIVLGILAVVAAFGGIVATILRPCLIGLAERIAPIIYAVVIALKPFYEFLAYCTAMIIFSQSFFYASHMAHFAWLLGGLIALASFFYSTAKHVTSSGGREKEFAAIVGTYCAWIFAHGAFAHRSTLLGFVACVGVFMALGFVIIPFGMGVAIGFYDKDATTVCAVSSLFFVCATFVISRFFPPAWRYALEPFRFGLYALGPFVFFLAMLIVSSAFSMYSKESFLLRQFMFLIPLFAFLSVGLIFDIVPITNAAGAFMFLFILEKYVELMRRAGAMFYVLLLIAGIGSVWIGFFLLSHPEWITSIFDF